MKKHDYKILLTAIIFFVIIASFSTVRSYILLRGSAPVPVINFPHMPHLEVDLECTYCHEGIEKSSALVSRHLPKESVCVDCHDKGETKDDCAVCHVKPGSPVTFPPKAWDTQFSHQLHLSKKIDCKTCHESIYGASSVKDIVPPTMPTCLKCHQGQFDTGNCLVCHSDIRTIKPANHISGWVYKHKVNARNNLKECSHCHSANYCIRCHFGTPKLSDRNGEQVMKQFIHSGNWEDRHGVSARRETNKCFSCHRIDSCSECHERFGKDISFQGGLHPAGWLDPSSKQFHGRKARVNPVACAACHDTGSKNEDPICMDCHGQGGINPHPKNWKDHLSQSASLTHTDADLCYRCHNRRGDNKLCTKCHEERSD